MIVSCLLLKLALLVLALPPERSPLFNHVRKHIFSRASLSQSIFFLSQTYNPNHQCHGSRRSPTQRFEHCLYRSSKLFFREGFVLSYKNDNEIYYAAARIQSCSGCSDLLTLVTSLYTQTSSPFSVSSKSTTASSRVAVLTFIFIAKTAKDINRMLRTHPILNLFRLLGCIPSYMHLT